MGMTSLGIPSCHWPPRFFESFLKSAILMKGGHSPSQSPPAWVRWPPSPVMRWRSALTSSAPSRVKIWISGCLPGHWALSPPAEWANGPGRRWEHRGSSGSPASLSGLFMHSMDTCRATSNSQHLVIPHVTLHTPSPPPQGGLLALNTVEGLADGLAHCGVARMVLLDFLKLVLDCPNDINPQLSSWTWEPRTPQLFPPPPDTAPRPLPITPTCRGSGARHCL